MFLGTRLRHVYLVASCIHPGGTEYGKTFALWYVREVVLVCEGIHKSLVLPVRGGVINETQWDLSKAELLNRQDLFLSFDQANTEREKRQKEMEANQQKMRSKAT